MSTRITTGKVRLSFPHLFQAKQINGEGDPKFSVMLLIPKGDSATIAALKEAETQAAEEGKTSKFGGKTVNAPSIIKDADEDGSGEDYPERAGHLYMTVSANQDHRPQVVDHDVQEILDQSQVYSGVYARVSLTAFPYKYGESKRGVSFGLNNVQVVGGGTSLAGGKPASADFEKFTPEGDESDLL